MNLRNLQEIDFLWTYSSFIFIFNLHIMSVMLRFSVLSLQLLNVKIYFMMYNGKCDGLLRLKCPLVQAMTKMFIRSVTIFVIFLSEIPFQLS